MKSVKNYAAASVLVLALSSASFAGDQQTPGYVDPAPQSTRTVADATDNNAYYVSEPSSAEPTIEFTDSLFLEALTALLSVY
jgi:hypothetical protein